MSQQDRQVLCPPPVSRPDQSLPQDDAHSIEKEEEAKLKAKYPAVARPGPGFLQKRLQKGVCLCWPFTSHVSRHALKQQKYFDSGDYNMAKAAVGKGRLPVSALSHPPPPAAPAPSPTPTTGDTIPTPDCLATRKTSIHVQSKLATGTS